MNIDVGTSGNRAGAPDELVTLTIKQFDADPHGVLRHHRALGPLVRHELGSYFVLRANDIERLATDPRLRAPETEFAEMVGITGGTLLDMFKQGMLTSNGEAHRRRRSPFTRAFAARVIAQLRPRIRSTAEALISGWRPGTQIDLVADYAALIPALTISDILGLPKEDLAYFARLVYQVSRILGFTFTPDNIPEIEAAASQLRDYSEQALTTRRKAPTDDLLSTFLAAADEAGELSPAEMIFQVFQLIIGGTDTTRVASAMQVALLLQHPEQWDAVCNDPSLVPAAVVESLRYEPSVASTGRVTLEDIDLDGHVLPAGEPVVFSLMSAMRDETVYAQPDVFNIRRTDHPRLLPVFGYGVHRCIGEALARVELEEGLSVLTAQRPDLRLIGDLPKLLGHAGIRRIGEVPVTWR
jgi:cytochrome P450 family 103